MSSKRFPIFVSCQIGFEEMVKNEVLAILAHEHLHPTADTYTPIAKNLPLTPNERQALYKQLSDDFDLKVKVGGVQANLTQFNLYQVMLWSRVASRVLLVLTSTYVGSDLELYNAVQAQPWNDILVDGFSFMVNFNGTTAALKNSHYSSLKVKDAIVDYYTNQGKDRPNVDTDNPQVIFDCRLHRDQLTLSLDLTGSMHKRYRQRAGTAPMRETLAASLLLRTSWDKESPVYNPMCGSGVLAIEAALIALNKAPGLISGQQLLSHWQAHESDLWSLALAQAQDSMLTPEQMGDFKVYASDNDLAVTLVAKNNAHIAGVADYVSIEQNEYSNLERQENAVSGLVILNPPYGVRLSSERQLYNLYYLIGQKVKELFGGWVVGIIATSEKLLAATGLTAERSWQIKNSNLDCWYKVYAVRQSAQQLVKQALLSGQAKAGEAASVDGEAVTGDFVDFNQGATTALNNLGAAATNQLLNNELGDAKLEQAQALEVVDFATIEANELSLYNRLHKNAARLKSYLTRNSVQNYRLYDADIPEYNIAVDVYTDVRTEQKFYVVQEYAAGKDISLHKALQRGAKALAMVHKFALDTQVEGTPEPVVIDKIRERQRGRAQYGKIGNESLQVVIKEYDCFFLVNLTDYIDTGIFLDNRDLRYFLRNFASGANFLNLFAYTGTATVHALKGGAESTTTVDLSNLYCQWASDHLKLNCPEEQRHKHRVIRADVLQWLDYAVEASKLGYWPDRRPSSDDANADAKRTYANQASGLFSVQEAATELATITSGKPTLTELEQTADAAAWEASRKNFLALLANGFNYGAVELLDNCDIDADIDLEGSVPVYANSGLSAQASFASTVAYANSGAEDSAKPSLSLTRKPGVKPKVKPEDKDERKFGDKKFAAKKFGERKFDDRKPFDGERKFGDKKFADKKFGDKKFGDRKFDDRKPFDRDRKPFDGERKFGDKKFGDRKFDDRKPFDRDRKPYDGERKFGKFGERKFDDRKQFDRDRKFDEPKPFDREQKPRQPGQYRRAEVEGKKQLQTGQAFVPYDLIFCDPPTFSNSKGMETTWDVQRDHVSLITKISHLLAEEGALVFCNNKRGFKLDYDALAELGLEAWDITEKTMPADFKGSKIHQAWLIRKEEIVSM